MRLQLFSLLLIMAGSAFSQRAGIEGFSDSSAAEEFKIEKLFLGQIDRDHIGAAIKEFSAFPHNVGSAGSRELAEKLEKRFREYGFETRIDVYQVLFPAPVTRILEMTAPVSYKALLSEPALKEDSTSGQKNQLPTFNAWSADGNVSAELVYVNYGLQADYEELDKRGISVKGRIVIARYGQSWRGIKSKIALEHGAVGCILYSDPRDDGYFQGDVYPKGAYKNEYGVQRGSVMDMVVYPGDPLTPGIGATAGAKRFATHQEAPNLLNIPVLPISYHDAKPLLENLGGPVAPENWRGALPITYHIGPGKSTVHLQLQFDWKLVPCYNVIATLRGSVYPDEWVIRGNHHDAWVNGAHDPVSGLASMMEEAKAAGALARTGWRPKRTLVYCAWDAEEPALVGSTEWVEDHAALLKEHTVVYINSDMNGRGFLHAGGSHALSEMMEQVARDTRDPQTGVSLFERWKAKEVVDAPTPQIAKERMEKNTLQLLALGTGSDFSPFLQHLGIPSLNLEFEGESSGGEYHSIYDSYDNFKRFSDPGFYYSAALSEVGGRTCLRMLNADILPFDFRILYKEIKKYTGEVQTLIDNLRQSTALQNEIIRKNFPKLATDPANNFQLPKSKPEVPFIDFSPLENAVARLGRSADHAGEVCDRKDLSAVQKDSLNQKLYHAEQELLLEQGLPLRPWYKHAIYAPGFYTGYSVKTLPGIREAIEERNFVQAETEIKGTAAVINRLADYLSSF